MSTTKPNLKTTYGVPAEALGGDPSRLPAREIDRLFRECSAPPGDEQLRVYAVGNHTLDPMIRRAVVYSCLDGVKVQARLAPFGQFFQAVLDRDSDLDSFAPHVLVLSLSLRRLAPRLVDRISGLSVDERRKEFERVIETMLQWASAARERTEAAILITNFWRPADLGLADARFEIGEGELYASLNIELARAFRADPQVHVVDVDHAIARAGRLESVDPRMYYLAKMEWHGSALDEVAKLLGRYFRSLVVPARKCVVLDLDNTLWGGVVGEEGPDGVRVSEGDPVGEAYRAFQFALRSLKDRGTVLAICSKNNFADAKEVFDLRRDMPLSLDDFAVWRINWEPKHQNIREIAEELNIGLDSLVFVDDNPAERELIRQMLPDVATLPLGEDPARYANILRESRHFDQLAVTEEDARKTEMYRENARREESRAAVGDLEGYLRNLDTRLVIRRATAADLNRVHQLFSKTNQFNLTTRRYPLSELERFIRADDWQLSVVSASDRFGDLGLIGTFLLRSDAEVLEIDSLMLSCRAMGRGIDTAMCNYIKDVARDAGTSAIRGRFVPTRKNAPAADFFQRQGFAEASREPGSEGARVYEMTVSLAEDVSCPGITVLA